MPKVKSLAGDSKHQCLGPQLESYSKPGTKGQKMEEMLSRSAHLTHAGMKSGNQILETIRMQTGPGMLHHRLLQDTATGSVQRICKCPCPTKS